MKAYSSFVRMLPFIVLSIIIGSCKDSSSPDDDKPYHETPVSALDPEPTEEMVRHLLDSGTFTIMSIQPKGHRPASLEDSIKSLVDFAVSKVSSDSATHIPYVWGGKHVDRPTAWSQPPESNASCTPRVGLDCSGFVQYCFDEVGFGRQAPELNVQSLSNLDNWQFMKDKGYYVLGLPIPEADDLMPGDVLIFSDGGGSLVHTGIFWKADANINGNITPAFINSAGFSSCERCYAKEDTALTGVVASPLGPYWQSRLVMAIRFTEWKMNFSAIGFDFVGSYNGGGTAVFVLDTMLGRLEIGGDEDTNFVNSARGHVRFFVEGFNSNIGTYSIPVVDYDAFDEQTFWYYEDGTQYEDSLTFTLSPPPSWWKGDPPSPVAGQLKITSISRGQYYGTIAGTFHFQPYSYYSRFEDSTYMIDTVEYTTTVQRYYSNTTEVKGSFSGLLGYK